MTGVSLVRHTLTTQTSLMSITVTGLRPQSGSGLRAQTTAPMEAGLRLYSCAPRSSCIYS